MFLDFIEKRKQGKAFIERMTRLLRLGVTESKAVLQLCCWSDECFMELLKVLDKFECYQTKDVEEKKRWSIHMNEGKMARGEVLTMTNKLLVGLSKVDQQYFMRMAEYIKEGKLSLEGMVVEYGKDTKRAGTVKLIEEFAGRKLGELQEVFKERFSGDIIDMFIGSEDSPTKREELKDYIKKVTSGKEVAVNVVNLETMKPIENMASSSDTVVI